MIVRCLILPLTLAAFALPAGGALAQGTFPAPLPGQVRANDPAFPPVNGQPPRNDPAFPPVNGQVRNDPAFPPVNGQASRSDPAFPPVNSARSDPAFPPVNGAPSVSLGAQPRTSFPEGGAAPFSGGFQPPAPANAGVQQDCMKGFTPLREDAEKKGKQIKLASDRHASPQEACKLIGYFSKAEVKMIKYVESHAAKCQIPPQIADQLKAGHKRTEGLLKRVCDVAQQAARGPAGPSLSEVLGSATSVPEANTSKKGGSTFDTLNGNVLER